MSKISTQCVVAGIAAAVNSIKHLENLLPNSKPISVGRAEYVLDTKRSQVSEYLFVYISILQTIWIFRIMSFGGYEKNTKFVYVFKDIFVE